jgi:hypothetical protein
MKNWKSNLKTILRAVESGRTAEQLAPEYGLSVSGMKRVIEMVLMRVKK